MTEYRLEYHPTMNPIPIGIWEVRDGKPVRLVALFKNDRSNFDPRPTYPEAEAMLEGLRLMDRGAHD